MENSLLSIMHSSRTQLNQDSFALTQNLKQIIGATLTKITYDLQLMTQLLVRDKQSQSKISFHCIQNSFNKQFISQLSSVFQQSYKILSTKINSLKQIQFPSSIHNNKQNQDQFHNDCEENKRFKRNIQNQINKQRAYYSEKIKAQKFRTYKAINLSALLMDYIKNLNKGFRIYDQGINIQKQYHIENIKKLSSLNSQIQNVIRKNYQQKKNVKSLFKKVVHGIIFVFRLKKQIISKQSMSEFTKRSSVKLNSSFKLLKMSQKTNLERPYSEFLNIKDLLSQLNYSDTFDVLIEEINSSQ